MIYKIKITEQAYKNYVKINEPYKSSIRDSIDKLGDLGLNDSNIKPLSGEFKGYYRKRLGSYRIVFNIVNDTITIISIAHRKEVYK